MTHPMDRSIRPALGVLAALALATLAACSSGAPAPTATAEADTTAPAAASEPATSSAPAGNGGDNTDWCLNTVEEVAAAIDIEVTEGAGTDAPGIGGGCTYTNADGSLGYAISVVTAEGAVSTFEAAKNADGAESISGIGDDAVLISAQGPLAVLKGSTFISIGALGVPIIEDAAAYRTALEELGRAAIDRLP